MFNKTMKKNDFDYIENIAYNDNKIDYGIIKGNEIIVFIKVGKDGSIYGFNNKYLQLANDINNKYGYTIICSSNSYKSTLKYEMDFINNYCENKFINYQIYYIGISNGASLGMQYGYNYKMIKRMLLINGPLMINFDKVINGIKKYQGDIYLIYGSLDPSIKYVKLLEEINNDKININIIDGENHHLNFDVKFMQMLERFLN